MPSLPRPTATPPMVIAGSVSVRKATLSTPSHRVIKAEAGLQLHKYNLLCLVRPRRWHSQSFPGFQKLKRQANMAKLSLEGFC